jgi:hypothetical protein
MITIRQFLGAMLEEVTRARVISDAASVRVAQTYLNHDFLKSYPVPRMNIKDIELELTFAVASRLHGVSIFQDEEVTQNIRHQLQQFLEALPQQAELAPHFAQDPQLKGKWRKASDDLDVQFQKIMSRSSADRVSTVHAISLAIENKLFDLISHRGFRELLARVFRRNQPEQQHQSINDTIENHVKDIILSVDTPSQEAATLTDLMDMKVLVEASELEKVNPAHMQKMKVVFNSGDRKWVADKTGEEKKFMLTRL